MTLRLDRATMLYLGFDFRDSEWIYVNNIVNKRCGGGERFSH